MTHLARLLAAVESGPVTAHLASRAFPVGYAHAINASSGDVNAAIALCKAMLPGFAWQIDSECAAVWQRNSPSFLFMQNHADDPARALFIAFLRALAAMERGEA